MGVRSCLWCSPWQLPDGYWLCCLRLGLTKNLSVNNVYAQFYFSKRNDGRRQMVERQETAVELLVPLQQFATPIEPTAHYFNHPTPGLLPRPAFELNGFLTPAFDMWDTAVLLNDPQSGRSGITSIGAQMLVSSGGWTGVLNPHGIQHRRQMRNIMPVGSGHSE